MKPMRIQRKRTKGWRMPDNTVYVGRPTKFGNPFRVIYAVDVWMVKTDGTESCDRVLIEYGHAFYRTKEEALKDAVRLYEIWLFPYTHKKGSIDDYFISEINLNQIRELKGKKLACFCQILDKNDNYSICHADILLSLANNLTLEEVKNENIKSIKWEKS